MGTFSYIRNFLRDPSVASVTPTSGFTVDRLCGYIDFEKDLKIVEYGPADGVFTKKILNKMTDKSVILAIETNKSFVEDLKKIEDPRLIVAHGSAENVKEFANETGWKTADYVLSGIPFSFLQEEVKNNILNHTAELLSREGIFLGYQTSGHLKKYLKRYFSHVQTEMEFLNIPPMCIYKAEQINGRE